MTLQDCVERVVYTHGGIRSAARALQIDHAYLSRLLNGTKVNPSELTLRRLRIIRRVTVTYELKPRSRLERLER